MTQPSTNNFLANNVNYGPWWQTWHGFYGTGNKTAALTTAGYVTGMRNQNPLVIPTPTSPATGTILTQFKAQDSVPASGITLVGLEVPLGSLNMSTGAFTDGSAMPSRALVGTGSTVATGAIMVFLTATVAITATTPTIAITYNGVATTGAVTGHTATLVFPTSPVLNTTFLVTPHLQSGDMSITDITNMTKSAGSAGTLSAYGFIPLFASPGNQGNLSPVSLWGGQALPKLSLQSGDLLNSYHFFNGSAGTNGTFDANVYGVADV